MTKQDMLVNYVAGEECRIAIVENGQLEELYTERTADDLHVSNIYRGRVTNVEPSIQAAFVDFGLERSGFLHISDLHPKYFPGESHDTTERVGKKTPRRDRPPIQACLKRGQEILVQVLKEGLGTKGPTLTSYLSIPGRFIVMMPQMERLGVSRKVEDDEQRREARRILDELNPPEGFGFILRTAGLGRTKTELKRDLAYLMRLWKAIAQRMKSGRGPTELYTESDLIIRTLRDVLTSDVDRIIIDDLTAARRAHDFLRIAMPRSTTKVIHYSKSVPLFDAFGIESQIRTINARKVMLKCGGSLVFDQTEALVAIDVNSGKFRDTRDSETTAFRTNQEAVDEIARQLRLRDLGGVVVLDLIDMYKHSHQREIERQFRDNLKKDRARTKPMRINELGLLSLTRQRMRPSLRTAYYHECRTCGGTGHVRTAESAVIDLVRQLQLLLHHDRVARAELIVSHEVAAVLFNRKRAAMTRLETELGKPIEVILDQVGSPDGAVIDCFDAKGVKIDVENLPSPQPPKFTAQDEVTGGMDEVESDESLLDEEAEEAEVQEGEASQPAEGQPTAGKKKRRRRSRRKSSAAEGEAQPQGEAPEPETEAESEHEPRLSRETEPTAPSADEDGGQKKKRRRRRRRRKKSEGGEMGGEAGETGEPADQDDRKSSPGPSRHAAKPAAPAAEEAPSEKSSKTSSRRRRRRSADKDKAKPDAPDDGQARSTGPRAASSGYQRGPASSKRAANAEDGGS